MSDRLNRRTMLKGMGVAGMAGLAGCTGNGGDDTDTPTDEPSDGGDGGGGDGGGGDGGGGDGGDGGSMSFEAKVGVLMPETGDLGSLGTLIRDGALLAATQINDAGGPVTVDTQVEDTQTDPQAGISGAEALVNSGYPGVVGPAASNVNLPVCQEVFIPNATVGMSPSSTAPAVTDLDDNDFVYRTCPSDTLQGPVMAQVATENLGASTAGVLFLNDAYGQALKDAFVSGFKDRDGQVVNEVSFEPGQASYSSQWSEVLNDNPGVVAVIGFPESGIQIFRDYYGEFASDNDADILVTDGLIDDDLPDEVDNDMANVTGTAPATAGPGAEFFNNAYQEEYDTSPGPFNAQAYDAMAILALAAVAAGENDGTAVRDNIRAVANPDGTEVTPENLAEGAEMVLNGEDVNYQGASGVVTFDDNGDLEAATYDVFEVQNREFEAVDQILFEN
ncbi:ABC transporter substrate-binding protein [Halorarius litoreus]|uniref:ABC transporter substrate-binding protein n=1 Tax=Halorarius litoreus TaxID=2962676 RepID=UPI0020CFB66E|nr:ABC transporter substrate-binding protein [Halorarius litoreus]